MSDGLAKALDIASRWVTPAGIILILVLQSQFVSRGEFESASEKLSGRVEKIEAVLIRMEQNAITDARHDNILNDHENRIRTLERGSTR
jgi:hypothetical protein